MPVKDRYHENVKNALIKDGWRITDDPLHLKWGDKDMYVDLAAERLIVAERGQERIAVEIKTFGGASDVVSLEQAIGQYCVYRAVMEETQRSYLLYLAVHAEAFFDVLDEPLGRLLLRKYQIPVIVFDPEREVILEWIHWNTTDT